MTSEGVSGVMELAVELEEKCLHMRNARCNAGAVGK